MGDDYRLLLQIDNYKRLRAEDAEKIRRLGVKVKKPRSCGAPRNRDYRADRCSGTRYGGHTGYRTDITSESGDDNAPYPVGGAYRERTSERIRVPVTLWQAVWVEYKGWWFWRRVKAIHQTIAGDNPYVDIRYSEYIRIE